MKTRKLFGALCTVLILLSSVCGGIPVFAAEDTAPSAIVKTNNLGDCLPVVAEDVQVGSRILDLLFGADDSRAPSRLIPGGSVFGVKIKQNQVTVADAKGVPALKSGDVILSINGVEVKSVNDVKRLVSESGGESVTVRALHNGTRLGIELRPTLTDGEYKLGISLRDGAVGIGTVTFIDPQTGLFGGLGHGICDSDSGEVIGMEHGSICGVILGGVRKGECGKPGELTGILTDDKCGTLTVNSECGVFGITKDERFVSGDPIPVASREEVREGEATVISTIKNGKTAEYKIEIFDIDTASHTSKSFKIRVTDETLKALTGGIVRGMSGSPIIQDGKLVGAVTHVMVANPTEGYGIFIENMLNASNARNELPAA